MTDAELLVILLRVGFGQKRRQFLATFHAVTLVAALGVSQIAAL